MKTKVLFYCTQAKPFLFRYNERQRLEYEKEFQTSKYNGKITKKGNLKIYSMVNEDYLNGKIVCECEVECEEIIQRLGEWNKEYDFFEVFFNTKSLSKEELMAKSCVNQDGLESYFKDFSPGDCPCHTNNEIVGYALHISNLKVFDEPLELGEVEHKVSIKIADGTFVDNYLSLKRPPQNMMWVWYKGEKYCLISIRPEWLCKILNGEKTIEVRKKILKGMM